MAATERIPVLLTAAEKGRIAKMSKAAGLSMGEFLRRAAASFGPSEDDKVLDGMIDQTNKTSAQAAAAIDAALAFVDASNKRIARMERKAGGRAVSGACGFGGRVCGSSFVNRELVILLRR